MQPSDYLTVLNILVAFLGVLFVVFTMIEWWALRRLRKNFQDLENRIREENHASMRAAHRIISSYAVKDVDARISLLESALSEFPTAFNGYNSLGYAYLEKGDTAQAIDAFRRAVELFPHDKAGYCDLASAYLAAGQKELAVKYLRGAIRADPAAKQDIAGDARFKELWPSLI